MTALRTFSVGALMALSLPFFTHAATLQELQAQVARLMQQLSAVQSQQGSVLNTSSSPGVPTRCPALARTLSRGMRGADVTQLQNFLISQNHLAAGNSTGFFGALTEAAVKKFQCAQNVVCTGTPASTGYGSVGAKTRAATAALCRKVSITSSYSQGSYTQGSYNTTLLPVTYSWQTGGWSACANSQQSRTVSCISSTNTTVADSFCTASKPAASQSCTTSTSSQSCTFNNQIVAHGASVTAYQASSVPAGQSCASQQRTCTNGTLSGIYAHATCSVTQATCTLPSPSTQTQTLACPAGQTGSITQMRSAACPLNASSPVWTEWATSVSTCTAAIAHVTAAPTSAFETGGSNYLVYDLGQYGTNPTSATYLLSSSNGGMKFVVPDYHLNPGAVRTQLGQMCAAGQKKIALMVFFSASPDYPRILNSSGGSLKAQDRDNLKNLFIDIKNAGCYDEVQFRISTVEESDAQNWSVWDESRYQENKSYIFDIHAVIDGALASSPIDVYYDLDAEKGGLETHPQLSRYHSTLWRDYTAMHGLNDSYAFSIAPTSEGLFMMMLGTLDNAGLPRPKQLAIDVYDIASYPMSTWIPKIISELNAIGILHTMPILVQETYYNDAAAFNAFIAARNNAGLLVRTIMQWAAGRDNTYLADGSFAHFRVAPPSAFSYVAPSGGDTVNTPSISSVAGGCTDLHCIAVSGVHFGSTCKVSFYRGDWSGGVLATLDSSVLTTSDIVCTDTYVSVRIPDSVWTEINALPGRSLNFNITNSTTGRWSNPYLFTLP